MILSGTIRQRQMGTCGSRVFLHTLLLLTHDKVCLVDSQICI